jgi:cytochrome d ubiquinol oxidase subunit II
LMPAFYLPVIIMLLALGLRGVSFDFRYQVVGKRRRFWDIAFSLGSMVAALMQGLIIGGLIQGVTITGDHFTGSVFDIFHLFPLLTALAVLTGYVVLGSGWLHLKATGILHSFAERILRDATPLFAGLAILSCTIATFVQSSIEAAWTAYYVALILIAILFLRMCQEITVSTSGQETVVPVTMKLVSPELEFGHLLVGNLQPSRIGVGVEFAFHR